MSRTKAAQKTEAPAPKEPPPPPPVIETSFSEQYWKFHKFGALGYRRDRQRISDSQSRMQIEDRNSAELVIGSHMEWSKVVIDLRLCTGWAINADTSNELANGERFQNFSLGSGISADAQGSLGLRLPFYEQFSFAIALIPKGGYCYSYLMDFPEKIKRFSLANGFSLWSYPKPIQQSWFGPYVEGLLELRFREKVQVDLFYQYHSPDLRWRMLTQHDTYLFNPDDSLSSAIRSEEYSKIHGKGLRKQLGGIDLKIHHLSGWTFGAHFEGSSTYSKKNRNHQKTTQEQLVAPLTTAVTRNIRETEVHWTEYMVFVFAGYKF